MLFSQRKGFKTVLSSIQKEGMNTELRVSLWNVLDIIEWSDDDFMVDYGYGRKSSMNMEIYCEALWFNYFKRPIDSIPANRSEKLNYIRNYFFKCEWFDVYDFLEFTLNILKNKNLSEAVNKTLERELSGYRFVNHIFTDIIDSQEIEMLEVALADDDFPNVQAHIRRAFELLSNRENPDYRNSMKESISAVEAMARAIASNEKATLGDALKVIEKKEKLHPSLREAFSKLYGYTNDADGIRHAMLDDSTVSVFDAKFFLISCTAFINYLKSKI